MHLTHAQTLLVSPEKAVPFFLARTETLWSVPRKKSPCFSNAQKHCWSVQKSSPLAHHTHCWSVLRKQFPSILLTRILMVSPLASLTHRDTAGQSPGISHTHCWSVLTKSSPPCITHCWSVPTKSSPLASHTNTAGQSKAGSPPAVRLERRTCIRSRALVRNGLTVLISIRVRWFS